MTSISQDMATSTKTNSASPSWSDRLQGWLPKIVLAPSMAVALICIYGYMAWTAVISFTKSSFLPNFSFAGFKQYARLMENDRWMVASTNLMIFGALFILICLAIGVFLAILLDQQIRNEGAIRTIYLYPMAISFIVTGTAWKWILNPTLGLEKMMQDLGWESFTFDWLVNTDMSIYTVVIAAVWQSSGFVMAMFLAGLRGIDASIIKAAQIDGASKPTIYRRIILPCLRPVFFSAIIVLAHIAIKSFDLVTALTAGGPGYSSDLPALFMYSHAFTRGQMGLGAASAIMMLMGVMAIIIPFLYSELRERDNG